MNAQGKLYDPYIWWNPYKFFLLTIALQYPIKSNETIKKKYYDFIQNLPIFIPTASISNFVLENLDKYPPSPYLDGRASLLQWTHFFISKVEKQLQIPLQSYYETLQEYYKNYEPKEMKMKEALYGKKKYMIAFIVILFIVFLYLYYTK